METTAHPQGAGQEPALGAPRATGEPAASGPLAEERPDPLLGALIGAYRVLRRIGEGGMGTVYEVVHTEVGQRAAVKVLRRQQNDSPKAVQRFFNEARAIGAVSDPGLIRLYDYGQLEGGTAYILMELLPGESLAQRLRALRARGEGLPLPVIRDLVMQIAQTLALTHARGIVHRDLKPDNVFLCPDPVALRGERAKVLDFGIAKFVSGNAGHQTTVGLILGTPTYMAPEQCEGQEGLNERVDVYALGVMLYELCAGTPPFVAESGATVMRQHIFRPPPALPSAALAPPAMTALLTAMLAKDPAERPTMSAVAERLRQMTDLPDGPRPAGPARDQPPRLPLSQIRTLLPDQVLEPTPAPRQPPAAAGERAPLAARRRLLLQVGIAGLCAGVVLAVLLARAARGPGAVATPSTTPVAAPATSGAAHTPPPPAALQHAAAPAPRPAAPASAASTTTTTPASGRPARVSARGARRLDAEVGKAEERGVAPVHPPAPHTTGVADPATRRQPEPEDPVFR